MKNTNDENSHWGIVLLAEIFALVFLTGFFPESWLEVSFPALFTLLTFTTIMALSILRKVLLVYSIGLFGLSITAYMSDIPALEGIQKILNFIFFSIVVVLFIRQIARATTVTKRIILDAVNGYVLLGIVFTFMVGLMLQVDPLSFNVPELGTVPLRDAFYYSFISFATVGYGDFVPLKPYAKSLSILIALSGQLYMATIIALLVGKFSAENREVKSFND